MISLLPDLDFAAPGRLWTLGLVAALAVAVLVVQLRRRRTAARFAEPALWPSVAPHVPRWRRPLVMALLVLSAAALSLGYAKPQVLAEQARERSVVVVALDMSTSMLAEDVEPDRLTAARAAAKEFILGLPEEVDVSLVSYNLVATVVRPASERHDEVAAAVDALTTHDGTALGDALSASVTAATSALDADPEAAAAPAARIVLLGDGGRTDGISVEAGTGIALDARIPVSTIAYGTPEGVYVDAAGNETPVPADREALQAVADSTGGTAYEAETADQLTDVYADIGSQVASDVERVDVADRFVGGALALLLAGALPSLLWFSRLL